MYDEWSSLAGTDCAFETKGANVPVSNRQRAGGGPPRDRDDGRKRASSRACWMARRRATSFRRYGRGWRAGSSSRRTPTWNRTHSCWGWRATSSAAARCSSTTRRRSASRLRGARSRRCADYAGRRSPRSGGAGDGRGGRRRWRATWTCGFPSRRRRATASLSGAPDPCPELPVLLQEAKVGVTPMGAVSALRGNAGAGGHRLFDKPAAGRRHPSGTTRLFRGDG